MYRYLDSLLAKVKKKVRTEFNHLGMMGFDTLNVVNTKKLTKEMFDRLMAENEKMYRKVADDTYSKAKKTAKSAFAKQDASEENKELEGFDPASTRVTELLCGAECGCKCTERSGDGKTDPHAVKIRHIPSPSL